MKDTVTNNSGKTLHIHFKCSKCNGIIDIDSQSLNFDYLKLNKKIEIEIYDSNIMSIRCINKNKVDIYFKIVK